MRTKQYDIENVGKRLKERRLKRNMSLNDLSAKTGICKSTLSRIESGLILPTLPTFALLCQVLLVDMNKICMAEKDDQPTTNTNNNGDEK